MNFTSCLTPLLTIGLPPLIILLARRRWPFFRRLRLTGLALSIWLLSLIPACGIIAGSALASMAEMAEYDRQDAIAQGAIIGVTGVTGNEGNSSDESITGYLSGYDRKSTDTSSNTAISGVKPLKISWYDPALGGINCMAPCDQMAPGIIVTEARYGRTAACIPEWTRARRVVVIPGLGRFDCLDTGGAIKDRGGHIWIDLLLHQPIVPFGTLVDDWYLE